MPKKAFIFPLLVLTMLMATGCESNNKGKIVGRWRGTHMSALSKSENSRLRSMLEFYEDGRMYWVLVGDRRIEVNGKYRLGSGDNVTFHLDKPLMGRKTHRETIQIRGTELTMIDTDGTTAIFLRE